MQAGDHAGSTHTELRHFADAALCGSAPEVTFEDGAVAVMMGIGAQRSIESGMPVLWADLAREYEAAKAEPVLPH